MAHGGTRFSVVIFLISIAVSLTHSMTATGFEKTKLVCNVSAQGPKLSRIEYDRVLRRVELIKPNGETILLMSAHQRSRQKCIWADKFIPAFGVNPDSYQATLKCADGVYYGLSIQDGASQKGLYMKRSADGLHRELLYLAACE